MQDTGLGKTRTSVWVASTWKLHCFLSCTQNARTQVAGPVRVRTLAWAGTTLNVPRFGASDPPWRPPALCVSKLHSSLARHVSKRV